MKTVLRLMFMMALVMAMMGTAFADEGTESKWMLGARGGIAIADGTPANDMMNYGLTARYRIKDKWLSDRNPDLRDEDHRVI